jgi:hypothetical protein
MLRALKLFYITVTENHRAVLAVLRIRDDYLGSRILIFIHPGSRILDTKIVTKERGEK